jgi:hypothetical protein
MKIGLAIIFTLMLTHGAMAQAPAFKVWNKWCADPDTLLLFPTGNNLIQIKCIGVHPQDLVVKSLDNALKIGLPEIKADTLSIMAMPYPKYGPRMRLAITDKKTKKVLSTVLFYGEKEPAPIARIGTIAADRVTKKELTDAGRLNVVFPESKYAYPYRIKSFTFKTRVSGKDVVLERKGGTFGTELLQIVRDAPEGTFLEFTNIKAICPECSERELHPIKLWIKN